MLLTDVLQANSMNMSAVSVIIISLLEMEYKIGWNEDTSFKTVVK